MKIYAVIEYKFMYHLNRSISSDYYPTIISFCIDTQILFNLRYYQRLCNGNPLLSSVTSSNGQIDLNACRDWCH